MSSCGTPHQSTSNIGCDDVEGVGDSYCTIETRRTVSPSNASCGEDGDCKELSPVVLCCEDKTCRGKTETLSCCTGDNCENEDSIGQGCKDSSGKEQAVSDGAPMKPGRDMHEVEKGVSIVEHVSLSLSGLTCTGCETKLFRALSGIMGIHNLSTSLVLSRAEFDLDEHASPVEQVIVAVEKATGFTCQRVNLEGQDLDIVVEGDAKVFTNRAYPKGVVQLTAVDKGIVRVTFDPRIVGARDVLGKLFGTTLQLAPFRSSSELANGQKHVRQTALVTLLSAALTIPVLILAWAPLPHRPVAYGAASLALATAVQFMIAGQFYVSALRALVFTRVIEMDLLIVLSTTTAYIFSIVAFALLVAGRPLQTGEFFETSTLLVTLIMLGRFVSSVARQKASESVSIRSMQVHTAFVCNDTGHNARELDARLLHYGDFFEVRPDSKLPTDGVIVSGTTEVDESMMTGESLPISKGPGSSVIAGSVNLSGVVVVRLTNLPGHNTISIIAAMVDEAKFQKPKTQELVDVVAGRFVPVILAITAVTFLIWIAVGMTVRHRTASSAVVTALTYAISVLIVSCPCAIGLCIPMVTVTAGGAAARHGVIFRSALALEIAHSVTHVVFDKTGTLTDGHLSVIEKILIDTSDRSRSFTLGATSNSKHPVAVAIASHLVESGIEAVEVEDLRSITGQGIECWYNGAYVRCGNTRWSLLDTHPDARRLLGRNMTVFAVTVNGIPVAFYGLADRIRPEAALVIAELKNRNIAISVVSGDDTGATNALAAQLGVPRSHTRSKCTPGDKQAYLQDLAAHGLGKTLFCGDGTNDAVALAQADVGVHMSGGSEIAQTAADVVLVRPALTGVLVLLDLSHAAMKRVWLNFAWSFLYNTVVILLAAGAFVHARISPQYAGLGEIVSVLPVILIALQLRWFKRTY